MTTPADEGTVDQGQDVEVDAGTVEGQENNATDSNPEAPSGNDLYAEYLEGIPTSLHPVVTDAFKKMDGRVTQRFQDLHSQYDPYKPIIEQWDPEPVQQAIALAQALESDPRAFAQGLIKAYNIDLGGGGGGEQGAANPVVAPEQAVNPATGVEYDLDDPLQARLAQQEELLRALADRLIGEDEAKAQAAQQAEQDAALEHLMGELKTKHGEFDPQYVYGLMAAGVDPEQAVQQFHATVGQWAAKQNAPAATAPRVMSGSGGLPSNHVDPATLNARQTKDLVAEYLRTAQGG